MSSRAAGVMSDLFVALRTTHSTIDLSTSSSTVRVVGGVTVPAEPPTWPYMVLSHPRVRTSYEGAIGRYRVDGEIDWGLFVRGTVDNPSVYSTAALEAAHDVMGAIEAAHYSDTYTTLFTLTELLPHLDDIWGDELQLPGGTALATGRITYTDYPNGPGI